MKQKELKSFFVENPEREIRWFKRQLKLDDCSVNTIASYCWTLGNYFKLCGNTVSQDKLLLYKSKMIETCAPESVNARIHAINRYMKEKNYDFRLKQVKIQPKQYIETISLQDYKYLKRRLKKDDYFLYLLVTGIATSGARISEILTLKVEHVYDCMLSIYGKGAKFRTVFLQKQFVEDCMKYLEENQITDGYVFMRQDSDEVINPERVRERLRKAADKYHLNRKVMHPHAFRHLFGVQYMRNGGDLVTLSSIMGHNSIETTKIYLLVSINEARAEFERIVKW